MSNPRPIGKKFKFPGKDTEFHQRCENYALAIWGADWRNKASIATSHGDIKQYVTLTGGRWELDCMASISNHIKCSYRAEENKDVVSHNPSPELPATWELSSQGMVAIFSFNLGKPIDQKDGMPYYILYDEYGTMHSGRNAARKYFNSAEMRDMAASLRGKKLSTLCGDAEVVALSAKPAKTAPSAPSPGRTK